MLREQFTSIDELQAALHTQQYVAERGLATAIYLAGVLERPELLLERHQERRRLVRPEHLRRMWVENHRHRGTAARFGVPPHLVEELPVAAMDAVEVADRHGAAAKIGRQIVERAE